VASKDVESWSDEDRSPVQYVPESGLDELSAQELGEISQLHIQDIDERVQFEKDDLVGKPFFLLDWHFTPGEYGDDSEFAVVVIRTVEDQLGFFTDGSTGVRVQLHKYQNRLEKDSRWDEYKAGALGGIRVPSGLRKSNYMKTLDDGTKVPATTYYFDNRDR